MYRIHVAPILALVFWTLCPGFAAAEGDAVNGEKLFARCSACHSVDGTRKSGPTLQGVAGRKAGAAEGARYSKALAGSDIVWDDASLDAYLEAPAKLVRGTTMTIRIPKPEERKDLIAYLKTLE